MAQPTGIHARRAALKMLDAVLRRGETLEQVGLAALRDVRDANDKALARAIAGEALRWLTDLDALIDSATKKPLPHDAKPRSVLRLMLAQALRLGTPPHAVIATGLPLLSGGPRRLAHGVFSTLIKREAALPTAPTLPEGVVARWGADRAATIAKGLIEPPEVDLWIKDPGETTIWQAKLGGESLAPGHVRVPRGTAIDKLEGYTQGAWWVQDLAATIPARAMGTPTGYALDLCAAPGGKTMALAAMGWKVTALDVSKRRLDALKQNLKRTGLTASTVRADALKWEPKHQFDAILLAAAHGSDDTDHVDATARAFAASAERLRETALQGAAFCDTARAIWGLDLHGLTYPVAVGTAARAMGIPLDQTLPLYLHAFASNLVSATQRALPLGDRKSVE